MTRADPRAVAGPGPLAIFEPLGSTGSRLRPETKRTLGWLMCLSGSVLAIAVVVEFLQQRAGYAAWWNAAGIALVGLVVVLAVVGRVLPTRILTVLWFAAAVAGPLLFVLSFAAMRLPPTQAMAAGPPWLWELEPVLICFPLLIVDAIPAIAWALVSALAPAASAMLFLGAVPPAVLEATPIHLGNVAFVIIYLGIARQLDELRRSERRAYRGEEGRARTAAESAQQAATSRIVHDEILSVLTVAMHTDGALSPEVRQLARDAVAVAETAGGSGATNSGTGATADRFVRIPSSEAIAVVRRLVQPIDPAFRIVESADDSTVPAAVADTIARAAAEAARNSVRHAGRDARRSLIVEVDYDGMLVLVADDGRGFDPDRISPERDGIRGSIIERMGSLDGGSARISSAPGSGTVVELEWHA